MSRYSDARAYIKNYLDKERNRLLNEIADLDNFMSQSPLSRICELRIEAQKLLKSCEDDKNYSNIQKKISEMADEEAQCFKDAKKQQRLQPNYIDKKVDMKAIVDEITLMISTYEFRGR